MLPVFTHSQPVTIVNEQTSQKNETPSCSPWAISHVELLALITIWEEVGGGGSRGYLTSSIESAFSFR